MSNLIFTFEDGSEYLCHYGVKGMKWGVWNADTRAKYSKGATRALKSDRPFTGRPGPEEKKTFGRFGI